MERSNRTGRGHRLFRGSVPLYLFVILVLFCAGFSLYAQQDPPVVMPPQQNGKEESLPPPEEEPEIPETKPQIYRSVRNRPIEVFVFGSGPRTVLIMAGVHGDEPSGVAVAREIISVLKNTAGDDLNKRIVVMPLINPDGYAAGTRRNSRGIDINRNYPAKNFGTGPKSRRYNGGKAPASEPETRAVMEVMKIYQPYLVISLHAPLNCINYSGPAREAARQLSYLTGLRPKSHIGYPTPGSFGSYYGRERGIQTLTVELPHRSKWSKRYVNAILTFLNVPH